MIDRLQQHAIPIVIAVAFYVSGFFTVANVLNLDGWEVLLGLIAGGVGGVCVFVAVLMNERRKGVLS